ncbi:hypothetical protein P3339_17495 [Microbulbifer sp. MLAF003]|uniref:DUF4886 domain-containing protein n=1 Tax=Microbulbifer sp. MLAF003 TaxID=3032582 RepID=UPI0024AE6148|nr:DUF4886 domain-containing protein [Microbulbifer sp. MLAF003]WHI50226.1 hypothetical protein P3339_17495 [Microbulbifer sp. MLAF003]
MKEFKSHLKIQIFFLIFLLLVGAYLLVEPKKQTEQKTQEILSVLFIGNSYTRPLPPIIQAIAKSNGAQIIYSSITPGGWTLQKHSESADTLEAIHERAWDYVVLQEQSQLPSFSEEQRHKEIYPYAKKLTKEIRLAGATPLLFLTWGRKHGDTQNYSNDTRSKMQARLFEGYQNIAQTTSSKVIPVGLAWETISSSDKVIDLYAHDGSHPNQNGVYLSAAVFVSYLLKQPQLNAPPINGISKETAELLAQQTKKLNLDP